MRVLILGASGMLGHAMMRKLSENDALDVYGTVRSTASLSHFKECLAKRILTHVDVEQHDSLVNVLNSLQPDVIINCIGLVKQLSESGNPLLALPINSILPHRLKQLCALGSSRLIHISTDCVFSGQTGNYLESDLSDATDLYGKSKFIGEVEAPHAITLRTSIIGGELQSANGLIGWFLSQEGEVRGYNKAIFSGLPTVELAEVVSNFVIPKPELSGLYHVSANPISKFELLKLVAKVYQKDIVINRDDEVTIDRSLNSSRFRKLTGYSPEDWLSLITKMYEFDRKN